MLENAREQVYELPDGTKLPLAGERLKFTEKLFQGEQEGLPNFLGIQHMVLDSITKSDVDIRRDLF